MVILIHKQHVLKFEEINIEDVKCWRECKEKTECERDIEMNNLLLISFNAKHCNCMCKCDKIKHWQELQIDVCWKNEFCQRAFGNQNGTTNKTIIEM